MGKTLAFKRPGDDADMVRLLREFSEAERELEDDEVLQEIVLLRNRSRPGGRITRLEAVRENIAAVGYAVAVGIQSVV